MSCAGCRCALPAVGSNSYSSLAWAQRRRRPRLSHVHGELLLRLRDGHAASVSIFACPSGRRAADEMQRPASQPASQRGRTAAAGCCSCCLCGGLLLLYPRQHGRAAAGPPAASRAAAASEMRPRCCAACCCPLLRYCGCDRLTRCSNSPSAQPPSRGAAGVPVLPTQLRGSEGRDGASDGGMPRRAAARGQSQHENKNGAAALQQQQHAAADAAERWAAAQRAASPCRESASQQQARSSPCPCSFFRRRSHASGARAICALDSAQPDAGKQAQAFGSRMRDHAGRPAGSSTQAAQGGKSVAGCTSAIRETQRRSARVTEKRGTLSPRPDGADQPASSAARRAAMRSSISTHMLHGDGRRGEMSARQPAA